MKRSIGVMILQIAVSLFLLAAGVSGLINSSAGDFKEVVGFLNGLFQSRPLTTILIIVLSVCEIIAGVFLFMELFTTDLRITDMILFIFVILWIVNIVLADFIIPIQGGSIFRSVDSVLNYLKTLSRDLMILGALVMVAKKFN